MGVENRTDGLSCPECGAPHSGGLNCRAKLEMILAWEYSDPELQAEHFLTVACYNLQHPAQFEDDAVAGLETALVDHLDHGMAVEEIRRRASRAAEGRNRVLKPVAARRAILRSWSMTISDVCIPEQPEGTAERVRRWARTIRRELR